MTEGPYYKVGSPERTDLRELGAVGKELLLSGRVLDRNCNALSGAWVDFWQADGEGYYDTGGYRFRGHQFTNANGQYLLQTVVPAEYPGRTPHLHVHVRAGSGSILTTQLYFPGKVGNETDSIFDPRLVVDAQEEGERTVARFDFILGTP